MVSSSMSTLAAMYLPLRGDVCGLVGALILTCCLGDVTRGTHVNP